MPLDQAQSLQVLECALKSKEENQDEMSVFSAVKKTRSGLTEVQLAIVEFCASECSRQMSGPLSVWWMLNAYQFAVQKFDGQSTLICEEDARRILSMIEPEKNASGYRKTPVRFANGNRVGWENIERQMSNLFKYGQEALDPVEFYVELERIHPAVDGNGRLGAILYNWKAGTLMAPQIPPKVDFSNLEGRLFA